jgi:hypothetical protein
MLVLAFLGFTNFSHSLPLNDKLLHFICFFVATSVFYWIIDVEEYVSLARAGEDIPKLVCLCMQGRKTNMDMAELWRHRHRLLLRFLWRYIKRVCSSYATCMYVYFVFCTIKLTCMCSTRNFKPVI